MLNTRDPAPIIDEAFWRGNLPFPAILFLFFLSSLRFPSQFLIYYNFNVGWRCPFPPNPSFSPFAPQEEHHFYNGADKWTQSAGVFVSQSGFV